MIYTKAGAWASWAPTRRPPQVIELASLKIRIPVGAALLSAFMAVLNIRVTNSSLSGIERGIAAGAVNGKWISTAYLIGAPPVWWEVV